MTFFIFQKERKKEKNKRWCCLSIGRYVPSPQSSLVHYNASYSCSLPLSLKFNLFQRLVAFMTDLRGADSLLQKAIKKVDDGRKLDAAQVGVI